MQLVSKTIQPFNSLEALTTTQVRVDVRFRMITVVERYSVDLKGVLNKGNRLAISSCMSEHLLDQSLLLVGSGAHYETFKKVFQAQ